MGEAASGAAAAVQAVVYYDPACGCCSEHVAYLRQAGFDVTVEITSPMQPIKERFGIISELTSCHTSVIDGYVVEGHMPVEAIERLLTERPDIKGISLPGMPVGSPGMPGVKTQTWTVYALHHDGETAVFIEM